MPVSIKTCNLALWKWEDGSFGACGSANKHHTYLDTTMHEFFWFWAYAQVKCSMLCITGRLKLSVLASLQLLEKFSCLRHSAAATLASGAICCMKFLRQLN
jgi:hypothetical protein